VKSLLCALSVGLCAAIAAAPAAAQYPSKPIRLIVPTPAGGPSDTAARALGQALSRSIGQAVVIENRPGAGGAIAAQAVVSAPPDGYTLLWGIASMAAIPLLQKSSPYQSFAELTPVSIVGVFAFGMFVHPDVPGKTVADFVGYGRAHPDKLSYATGTLGEYMAAAQFFKITGISSVRVPYKGGAQLMPDLISGRVQVNFGPVSSGLQHVKEGRLRMLAILLPQRSAVAPDVPTLAEAGVASVSLPTWQAIFAPPRTPRDIADRLSREVALVLRDPAVRAQFDQQALQPEGSTPEALAAAIAGDVEAWRSFIRENNIPQE
jgi:tripartite-type tricarboxylate transporter receptor subunit TctC